MPDLFNKLNLDFNIKIDFDIEGFKITRASFWVFSQLIICWHCNEKFLGFTLNQHSQVLIRRLYTLLTRERCA